MIYKEITLGQRDPSSIFTPSFMKRVINETLNFKDTLNKIMDHKYSYNHNVFCPFHDNYDTPAAKLYNNNGVEAMFCFSCGKQFKVSDLVEEYFPTSLKRTFEYVWSTLSNKRQEELKNMTDNYDSTVPVYILSLELKFKSFKKGESSIQDILNYLSDNI